MKKLVLALTAVAAFLGLSLRTFDLGIFAQIGLAMLIGLAAKNAILIVEFARDEMKKGRPLVEVAEQLNQEGFRPPKRAAAFSKSILNHLLWGDCEFAHSNLRVRANRVGISDDKRFLRIVVVEISPEHRLHHLCERSIWVPLPCDAPQLLSRIEVNIEARFPAPEPVADPFRYRIEQAGEWLREIAKPT